MTPVSRSRRRATSSSISVSRWRVALARMVRRRVASTGLLEEVIGAELHGVDGELDGAHGGEDYDGNFGR